MIQRLNDRIHALEAFAVVISRPSGDQRQLRGCLPDERLESLSVRVAEEFEMPVSAILLCRGSRQFVAKDMLMSLSDLGINEAAELTCICDTGCRRHWQLRTAAEGSDWEAMIYNIELYDQHNRLVPTEGIVDVRSNAERNAQNVANNAFDGRPDTFWETTFGSGKIGGWVACTFQEPVAIHRIRLQQASHVGNTIRSFEILNSEAGVDWTHVWTAIDLGSGWSEASAPGHPGT